MVHSNVGGMELSNVGGMELSIVGGSVFPATIPANVISVNIVFIVEIMILCEITILNTYLLLN